MAQAQGKAERTSASSVEPQHGCTQSTVFHLTPEKAVDNKPLDRSEWRKDIPAEVKRWEVQDG